MKVLSVTIAILFSIQLAAQEKDNPQYNTLGLSISTAFNIPGGDLSDRFGTSTEVGIGLEYLMSKTKLIFSIEGDFIFGSTVKEDVLSSLRTTGGNILGNNGAYADVFLRQRGFHLGLMAEKLLSKDSSLKGLRIGGGIGVLNHKIRIQDDTQSVSQLSGDYKKGYDRNSRGLAVKERIAYNFVNETGKINFSVGLELTQAFTKNTRGINFDTALADTQGRLDLIYALQFKWLLPLHSSKPAEEIFY